MYEKNGKDIVQDMSNMFMDCKSLQNIDLNNLDIS